MRRLTWIGSSPLPESRISRRRMSHHLRLLLLLQLTTTVMMMTTTMKIMFKQLRKILNKSLRRVFQEETNLDTLRIIRPTYS